MKRLTVVNADQARRMQEELSAGRGPVREVVVVSGKGGTGKTSIVASFAAMAETPLLVDCDVDAADLHLVLNPVVQESGGFSGGKTARVREEHCNGCSKCYELCRFEAIVPQDGTPVRYAVDPLMCEGCGVCAYFCPEKAIAFEDAVNGRWYSSVTRFGPMIHAQLGIAEENSGKLVSFLRKKARETAEKEGRCLILVDGPPGIGCPVIASIGGADLLVLVTEPTVSGEHDLARVAELADHFGVPALVCINKADLNVEMSDRIAEWARKRGLQVAGRIRYDKAFTRAQVNRSTVAESAVGGPADDLKNVWERVLSTLN
ncbi:MAG: ATP-binding protein [Thermoanaerobacterales bacterium]|nr:ATP-binding protein [Thermoanaerobacterales bacterium]